MHVCLIHDVPCKSACMLLMHACLRRQLISGFLVCIFPAWSQTRYIGTKLAIPDAYVFDAKTTQRECGYDLFVPNELSAHMCAHGGRSCMRSHEPSSWTSETFSLPIASGPMHYNVRHTDFARLYMHKIVCCIYTYIGRSSLFIFRETRARNSACILVTNEALNCMEWTHGSHSAWFGHAHWKYRGIDSEHSFGTCS
jgi:hypothetical protein